MENSLVSFDENSWTEANVSKAYTPSTPQFYDEDSSGFSSVFANLYKQTGTKLSQEDRRQELLKNIKLRRNQCLNQRRGILEDIEEDSENEVDKGMDVEEKHCAGKHTKKNVRKLMLSEWLTEIPFDFETDWLVKLCPEGSRALIIACNKITKAYNKFGRVKNKFHSMLPGGSPTTGPYNNKQTILDCIYCHSLQTYFVLDVLVWNSKDLRDCETDFRFFFLKSKLNETPGITEINIFNKYNFIEIDYFPAERLVIENKILEHYTVNENLIKLDGILFYHKETPYFAGVNPLVEWLKPSMLPDILHISVPEYYMKKKMDVRESGKKKKKIQEIEVLPGLYVGNYRDSKDPAQLAKYKITHILAIHDTARRLHSDKHYLCVMASDSPDQNLTQYFSVCNDFIHAARLRDGNVLIHCLAGMSRSVTVAVAYIMSATQLSSKEALKVVRAGRAVANPNIGFQKQLQDFESSRIIEERRRLKERFPSLALVKQDEDQCALMLNNYEELLSSRNICEGRCSMGEDCPTGVCRTAPTRRSRHRNSQSQTSSGEGITRTTSTISLRPRSGPAGLRSYTGSVSLSRSGSKVELSRPGGRECLTAPATPQCSPPVSPKRFENRRLSKQSALREDINL